MTDREIKSLISSMHFLIDVEDSLYTLIAKNVVADQGLQKSKNSLEKNKRNARKKQYHEQEEDEEVEKKKEKVQGPTRAEKEAIKNLTSKFARGAMSNFDQKNIPIDMITIQIELSRLLDRVLGIGAGILTLHDIINMNKRTFNEEVRSFF